MNDEKHTKIQRFMDGAYAKWEDHDDWRYPDFLAHLDDYHALAVIAGNLNYQVYNGGFEQWVGNGYGRGVDRFSKLVASYAPGNTCCSNVLTMAIKAARDPDGNHDALSKRYVALGDAFLDEIEKLLPDAVQ